MKAEFRFIIFLWTLAVGFSSCKKWLDVNTDPTYPQETTAATLIAPITFRMADGLTYDNRTINFYTQATLGDGSGTSPNLYSLIWERHGFYQPLENIGERMWRTVYYDLGRNLEEMIAIGKEEGRTEYVGIGYAIKAWAYQMLTDMHGPIILDEAFTEGQLTFRYQNQSEVYERVRQWCDSSIRYLNLEPYLSSASQLAGYSGDNIYQGNLARWIKFAHAVRAIQYGRLVNKPNFASQYADSVIKYVDLSFESVADDAKVRFRATNSNNSNPWGPRWGRFSSTYYFHAGAPVLRYMTGGMRGEYKVDTTGSVDPRLSRMLYRNVPVDSVFRGALPTEGTANVDVPAVLGLYLDGTYQGKFIFKDAASFPIISYSQLMFIKAEAAFIKGDLSMAYDSYRNGIVGSMNFVNSYNSAASVGDDALINETELANYMASSEVAHNLGELTLADIMGQKYVALWPWGSIEIWSDLRKHGYDLNVFKQFIPITNLEYGDYAYRLRPRYYSEYSWNRNELERWGALESDYGVQKTWFATAEQ